MLLGLIEIIDFKQPVDESQEEERVDAEYSKVDHKMSICSTFHGQVQLVRILRYVRRVEECDIPLLNLCDSVMAHPIHCSNIKESLNGLKGVIK